MSFAKRTLDEYGRRGAGQGASKTRSPLDWLLETRIDGGTGVLALIAFVLSTPISARIRIVRRPLEVTLALTAFGLLAGARLGERGIS